MKVIVASEILAVPEEHLEDVIHVIRRGLQSTKKALDKAVVEQLTKWCDEKEAYLERLRISGENKDRTRIPWMEGLRAPTQRPHDAHCELPEDEHPICPGVPEI